MIFCTILILAEIPMATFAAWCILNEERLIEFEDNISKRIRRKLSAKQKIRK